MFFEGQAGAYHVRVVIRPPAVVPGLAEISVRVLDGGTARVSVLPVHFRTGIDGSPPPDVARPVEGERDLYAAELWLMERGTYSVVVDLDGERGAGRAVVPVNAVATRRLDMPVWYGAMLLCLGAALFVFAVAIAGAAAREGSLAPGLEPDTARRQRARVTAIAAACLIALALWGGKSWWDHVDADFRSNKLFLPTPVMAEARVESDQRLVSLRIDRGDTPRRWSPFIPDHGKLMHLFLIRDGQLDAFAHLHPVKRAEDLFEVLAPPVPAGRYLVYADVTRENGFAETLTATVELSDPPDPVTPPRAAVLSSDPDDSWALGRSSSGAGFDPRSTVADGLALIWKGEAALRARREVGLRFSLEDGAGNPQPLEPYMGMLGHAALRRDDGAVFAHLHPVGTISMASQELFESKKGGRKDSGDAVADPHAAHRAHAAQGAAPPTEVSFPYEFPRAGRYRVWVQVKSAGRVLTGVWDVAVGEP